MRLPGGTKYGRRETLSVFELATTDQVGASYTKG